MLLYFHIVVNNSFALFLTLYKHLVKSATSSTNKKGIFPKSHVKVVENLSNALDTDVVLSHLHQALYEWGNLFKACFKVFFLFDLT